LRVEKLLCDNIGKVFVDLELPLVEEAGLGEIFNKLVDAIKAILGLSDHLATEITHLVWVLGEIFWQGCFMATRWDQMDVFASL